MTTVTELKKLFIELGGNPEDLKGCQTDADVIKLLSEVVGSTIELPAVSDSDNGKVLKVIEGAWGKGTDEALPEVTSGDNGKVLKVVEGAWGKGTDESLPEVTAADNGKVLSVVGGQWGKKSLIKKATFSVNQVSIFDGTTWFQIDNSDYGFNGNKIIIGAAITGPIEGYIQGYISGEILTTSSHAFIRVQENEYGFIKEVPQNVALSADVYYIDKF